MLTQVLLEKLEETKDKCEFLSVVVDNQERHFTVAAPPRTVENRGKANAAYKDIYANVSAISSLDSLLSYFHVPSENRLPLESQKGLFYRIYRGKMNKYVIPVFVPQAQQEQVLFKR